MKKPRKPKAKAKPRATRPVAPPRRAANASPRPPAGFGHVLGHAERKLASRLSAWGVAGRATAAEGWAGTASLARRVAAYDMRPKLSRLRNDARAFAAPYSHDEREALALLVLPFLLVASAIVVHQSVRTLQTYIAVVASPDVELTPLSPRTAGRLPAAGAPASRAHEVHPEVARAPLGPAAPETTLAPLASPAPLHAVPTGPAAVAAAPPETLSPQTAIAALPEAPQPPAATSAPPREVEMALLAPVHPRQADLPAASPPPLVDAFDVDAEGRPVFHGICAIDAPTQTASAALPGAGALPLDRHTFGQHLAKAAEAQVGGFVIYNDAYRRIAYPMGDVNPLFGVCTDVIVRAYRALGVDLQALVHQARSGTGDTNIDHRRTEVLRRFFAAHGESLPITSFPENFRPGDIVTYYRPQNRRSRSHIAMVSSVIAPSGRPMIVHNRGWGPQLEDALFVDQITGHYRYGGPPPSRNAAAGEPPVHALRGIAPTPTTVVPASFPGSGLNRSAAAR